MTWDQTSCSRRLTDRDPINPDPVQTFRSGQLQLTRQLGLIRPVACATIRPVSDVRRHYAGQGQNFVEVRWTLAAPLADSKPFEVTSAMGKVVLHPQRDPNPCRHLERVESTPITSEKES